MITAVGRLTLERGEAAFELIRLFVVSLGLVIKRSLFLRVRGRETVEQMYESGVQSLPVIVLSLSFISLMLILELSFHMKLVLRQDSLVPAFSTLLMFREMGPVVTCLLLTSRVGAGIAAEIGTMKVTEQIDALRLLSIDPVEYLTLPRWFGCVFAANTLTVLSIAISILGGASIASVSLGYTMGEFFNTMFTFCRFSDLVDAILKATVFGSIIPIVASHHGFRCKLGSEGVGNAATSSVVHSSMLIIIADFVLTYLLYAV